MKKHPYKNKRRLHLIPLLLGIYATLLGLSLTAMGLAELGKGIGIFRLLLGLGMAGFGLFGIWDGIRDLLKPEKTSEKPWFQQEKPASMKSSGQAETPLLNPDKQPEIEPLESSESDLYKMETHSLETCKPEMYKPETYKQETTLAEEEENTLAQKVTNDWQEVFSHPNESPAYGHPLLVIFKESWREEHKFFSIRDVELTVEGIQKGTYQKAVLEWGTQAFELFPGVQSDLLVVWCLYFIEQKDTRFFTREGTVTQVTFWLNQALSDSALKETPALEEMAGWSDITSQVKKSR